MSCEYIIEKHTHGWLICARLGQKGVPIGALEECRKMMKGGACIDPGIVHHFNALRYPTPPVFAVVTPEGAAKWRAEIAEGTKGYSPEERWWFGTDVGASSAAMFAVLCSPRQAWCRSAADKCGGRSTPQDPADFDRCLRLLETFPEWRGRLNEVADAYPETAWPWIIAAWEELEKVDPKRQNDILNECHKMHKRRTS